MIDSFNKLVESNAFDAAFLFCKDGVVGSSNDSQNNSLEDQVCQYDEEQPSTRGNM